MREREAAQSFVLELGRGLHLHGYPAHRLEEALQGVSARLGLEAQLFSTPTALFASFGVLGQQRTFQVRVEPGSVNLARLAALDTLARRVARGEVSPADGLGALGTIMASPAPYGPALTTLAFAVASGTAARFFSGGWGEMAVAALIGLLIGLLALLVGRFAGLARLFEPLSAATAALVAAAAAHLWPVSAYVAMVAGLIVLIPGFTLTVALTELATRNLVSGVARLAGAVGTFLVIAFGVALGSTVAARLLGPAPAAGTVALPGWTQAVALLLASLAFTVLLRADPRDAPRIVAGGVFAFVAAREGAVLLGPELGAFLGALGIGLLSALDARRGERPDSITLVPGILLLVPGSIGFQSLSWLLDRATVPGVEAAFRMVLVAVSLATGLLVASALLPVPGPRAEAPPRG